MTRAPTQRDLPLGGGIPPERVITCAFCFGTRTVKHRWPAPLRCRECWRATVAEKRARRTEREAELRRGVLPGQLAMPGVSA